MKAIKIILAVAIVAIIGFFVWRWMVSIDPPRKISPPTKQIIPKIEKRIDSLKKMPANKFCQKFYEDILYLITDNHKEGNFSDNENDNNQWQEIFSKNLYSAYAPLFAEQAMYVFNNSQWRISDLNFIRSEVNKLRSSSYLDPSGPVANSYKTILLILAKYDEIAGFIFSCNSYSYSYNGLDFSYPDVSDKIQRSKTYLRNGLDNSNVSNCTRLKKGLHEIPQNLFSKHISYLRSKIQLYSNRYRDYDTHKDYSNNIYTPLKNQIDALDNEIYGVSDNTFSEFYSSLNGTLNEDNHQAYEYFRSLRNNNY